MILDIHEPFGVDGHIVFHGTQANLDELAFGVGLQFLHIGDIRAFQGDDRVGDGLAVFGQHFSGNPTGSVGGQGQADGRCQEQCVEMPHGVLLKVRTLCSHRLIGADK